MDKCNHVMEDYVTTLTLIVSWEDRFKSFQYDDIEYGVEISFDFRAKVNLIQFER